MMTNNPTRVNRTEVLPGISDHEVIICELEISPTTNKQIKRSIPLYIKAHLDLLSDHIKNIEITHIWSTFGTYSKANWKMG